MVMGYDRSLGDVIFIPRCGPCDGLRLVGGSRVAISVGAFGDGAWGAASRKRRSYDTEDGGVQRVAVMQWAGNEEVGGQKVQRNVKSRRWLAGTRIDVWRFAARPFRLSSRTSSVLGGAVNL